MLDSTNGGTIAPWARSLSMEARTAAVVWLEVFTVGSGGGEGVIGI
ncbi:MAG: hypothetical protein AMXMBFR25_23360 [Lysobacterales bacterium]